MSTEAGTITRLLRQWSAGDVDAKARMTEAIYSELRRVAGAVLRGKGPQTLQPTELLHEFYFRLPGIREIDWRERAQFLAVAAKVMRNIVVDHARRRQAAKRGRPVEMDVAGAAKVDVRFEADVLMVHGLLDRLAEQYPRHAAVVELRFFGGMTAEEASEVLCASGETTSPRTVERDWTFAKAWLRDAIDAG